MTDQKKTYSLLYPIEIEQEGGQKLVVTEVTIGRMKAKHLKLMPMSPIAGDDTGKFAMEPSAMLPLIAALANLSLEVIEELDMEDLTLIVEEVGSFFGVKKSQ